MKKMLLVGAMILLTAGMAIAAGGQEEAGDEGPVTLTVQMGHQDIAANADWDDLFWTHLVEQKFNVELDITPINNSVAAERMNIALSAGELADLMFGSAVWTIAQSAIPTQQWLPVRDRVLNGSGWINHPLADQLIPIMTAPDGEIYRTARGNAIAQARNGGGRVFWNRQWVEDAGGEWPVTTLEQGIDVLYAMKELYPDLYPMSGRFANRRSHAVFMNAYGMNSHMGGDILSRLNEVDGELVLSFSMPQFGDYLALMRQMYEDEILDPEYFTQQMGQMRARAAQHGFGLIADGSGGVLTGDNVAGLDYYQVEPLQSEWNPDRWWPEQPAFTENGIAIAAYTEHPDEAFEIFDWHGTPEASFMNTGYIDDDWLDGLDVESLIPEGLARENIISSENDDGTLNLIPPPAGVDGDPGDWGWTNTYIWPRSNGLVVRNELADYWVDVAGPLDLDPDERPGDWFHLNGNQTLPRFFEFKPSPRALDFTGEELEVVQTYQAELTSYIDEMHAKFILGVEPLSGVAAFQESLNDYGLEPFMEVVNAAYQRYLESQQR